MQMLQKINQDSSCIIENQNSTGASQASMPMQTSPKNSKVNKQAINQ
jgi:hypothetical protein